MNKKFLNILLILIVSLSVLSGCSAGENNFFNDLDITAQSASDYANYDLSNIPDYDGKAYVELNGNVPEFSESEKTYSESFEEYGKLDSLGRCTYAVSCIGKDLMPTEKRGSIGSVKPSGWHISKYDFVDGKYLYNRCHLIGYQLTAENANERNLITGTRYLNVEGMLPFENDVADYIEITNNHVYYKVTPIFEGNNLVANGVQMQAYSVEDNGQGISFNVYCYNVQPGVAIDYATGDNQAVASSSASVTSTSSDEADKKTYIVNTKTKKFHNPDCEGVKKMSSSNKKKYKGTRDSLISNGYSPCQKCNP
ncbi:prophage Lp1 protein 65 [Firmicutes bacterium CAG:341]|mgnify:FL=1|uniref:DNA/RNA non-specific endonuclease n=1 Tax=Eubacterium sp. TaxID=142586 RepID=UPI00033E8C16|nr:prophage Lp1 protein 65 [Firmicutes bacterium CAG:341]